VRSFVSTGSPDDMERDFPIPVEGSDGRIRRKRVEIAIFGHKQPHTLEHLRRVVICRPEPRNGRGVTKLRDHRQARKDIEELWQVMAAAGSCHWGMWTNNVDHFYYYKEDLRFGPDFKERAGWPLAEEIVGTKDAESSSFIRRGVGAAPPCRDALGNRIGPGRSRCRALTAPGPSLG
jgi:type I restriction enzyme M protein